MGEFKEIESMEEFEKSLPPMSDEEKAAFMETHGLTEAEPDATDDEDSTDDSPEGEEPKAGEEQDADKSVEVKTEEPTPETKTRKGPVPYAALKEERDKRKAESERAKQYESQLTETRKHNEELQKQYMEMQKQLLETVTANKKTPVEEEEVADPLRDTVLGYVKPLIEPFQKEREEQEKKQGEMAQMGQRATESEKRARGRYEDYEERTKDIFAFAKQRAAQGDPSYSLDILSQKDPAEYAYNLSFRLEKQKGNKGKEAPDDQTNQKLEAIAKHPRAGKVPGGGGTDAPNLAAKLEKVNMGEMKWGDLTPEEQKRALNGSF